METITLYHATNTPIEEIGIEKQTMFFTGCHDSAKNWGEDHYEDYDILEIEMPIEDVCEYVVERQMYAITDFEQLEVKQELIIGKCVHFEDCSDGYIVRNINDYKFS